jgi:hypothetical protein
MRRLPILSSAAVLLFSGCDLFSTREVLSKPSEIRVLPKLSQAGDSASFLAVEAVWRAGAKAPEQVLSRRRVAFACVGDSVAGGDTLKRISMTVRDDSTGALVDEGERLVRFSSAGVLVAGVSSEGVRYFPIASALAPGDSAEADAFLSLPLFLMEGWDEAVNMGIFTVKRIQSGVDTLPYHGHDEEAWVVSESVEEGGRAAASGQYWYGSSGLLRAEHTWDGFDWRGDNGAPLADGGENADAELALRRTVVRL